jgi:hypothetical protein
MLTMGDLSLSPYKCGKISIVNTRRALLRLFTPSNGPGSGKTNFMVSLPEKICWENLLGTGKMWHIHCKWRVPNSWMVYNGKSDVLFPLVG